MQAIERDLLSRPELSLSAASGDVLPGGAWECRGGCPIIRSGADNGPTHYSPAMLRFDPYIAVMTMSAVLRASMRRMIVPSVSFSSLAMPVTFA